MRVGSLFSGIGGIEIGFEKQGFETEWFVENEPYAQEILKKRFPGANIYGDITELDFKTVPKIDILTGGFPCQDISNAGKRVGIEGSRSSLWKYYFKAISTLRPRVALIENVSALTNRGLDVVLCDLAKIGYDAEWYCVSASTVGAPHKRERIFILAYPNCNRQPDESFDEGEGQGFVDELSDTSCVRRNYRCNNRQERHIQGSKERSNQKDKPERSRRFNRAGAVCKDVPNSDNKRWAGRREAEMGCEELSKSDVENSERNRVNEGSRQENNPGEEGIQHSNISECPGEGDRGWWAVEPELGRVANGIPNRVDRIKCLGNAVVPQVAEIFAEAIKMKFALHDQRYSFPQLSAPEKVQSEPEEDSDA